jgi:polysaccharide deacetylase family protein (PEP-CTERM system associated)
MKNVAVKNALSFDVEDYFQVSNFESFIRFEDWDKHDSRVERNTRVILDILAERQIHATFFVLGWVAEKFPQLVRAIAQAGHELATHSYRHRLVYSLDPREFRRDLRQSIDLIEQAGGQKVLGHRAPSFSITEKSLWALDIMQEEGLRYDSSVFPVRHPRYGIPDAPRAPYEIRKGFWEFPMATFTFGSMKIPVAGGAYFRLYPYPVTRWGLRRINREGKPLVMYLHPWEFDPQQPRFATSLNVRLRHYGNLHKTESRFRRLCGDFEFGTVTEVLGL